MIGVQRSDPKAADHRDESPSNYGFAFGPRGRLSCLLTSMNIRRFILPLVAFFLGFSLRAWSAETPSAPASKPGYTVTVELQINENGIPEGYKIIDSQDPTVGEILDKVAISKAIRLQLDPREKDGHRVKYIARVPFYFPPIEGDEGAESNKGPRPVGKTGNKPVYPQALRDQGVAGGAILEFFVTTDGKVDRLKTLRSSRPEFAQAATEAVSGWVFHPALQDGKPIETRWRMAVIFETKSNMADLVWRLPPRPSLGTFVVAYDDVKPVAAPAAAPAAPATPAPGAPMFTLPPAQPAPAPAPDAAPAK